MRLSSGARLGAYEILGLLGAGGMGEVYRARDAKLGREVALKTLPEEFARDAERLARLEREARALAALNHPNIATLYGFENHGGVPFLVMELVEGESLADRIARGRLSHQEATGVFPQIAEALGAAHDKGIVHRDLKPANVRLTPDGKVKVLDFGLAKAYADPASPDDLSKSPTSTYNATRAGVVMGTASYMSPEQARGRPVDRRSDIWSFGCVLFEARSGRKAFEGETIPDVLAAVLTREPDWGALPPETSGAERELMARCLQKDPGRRLRDAWDIKLFLEGGGIARSPSGVAGRPRRSRWLVAAGVSAVAVAFIAGLLAGRSSSPRPESPLPKRFTINLPAGDVLIAVQGVVLALSPDGRTLVYVATRAGVTQLFRRALGSYAVEPIPGTGNARGPFFSPDGEWVGFFVDGKLKKVSLTRGSVVTVADAAGEGGRGGAWGENGTIVFAGATGTLLRVSAEGGAVSPATAPPEGESEHRWPEMLPGGKAFLFTDAGTEQARIVLQSLETGDRRVLIEGATGPRYSPTGHIVFARAEGASETETASLWALPFDAERRQATGPPQLLLEGVGVNSTGGAAHFDVAPDGTLVFFAGGEGGGGKLTAVDRKGVARPLRDVAKGTFTARFSPDGRRLAVVTGDGGRRTVWIMDLARGSMSRLTPEEGRVFSPAWSPDGEWVAFGRVGIGKGGIMRRRADGSGPEETLTRSDRNQSPFAWSPDGRSLVFGQDRNVLLLPLQGASPPEARPLLATAAFSERDARISPDGHWLAYTSTESGRSEVHVTSFPEPTSRFQVSADGGSVPTWGRGGRELFYVEGESRIMTVEVTFEPRFQAARPRLLFEASIPRGSSLTYDAAPDGMSFVVVERTVTESATRLRVLLHWPQELAQAN